MADIKTSIPVQSPSALWKDYELVDCGDYEKLERFGSYYLRRPEPKALWGRSMSEAQWQKLTHTCFKPGAGFAKAGKEDCGTWERLKTMDDQWKIRYGLCVSNNPDQAQNGCGQVQAPAGVHKGKSLAGKADEITLRLGLTSFKHVGVFPEQAPNWDWIHAATREIMAADPNNIPKVLNLFAYTGGASLAAKAAGADVTHLDSVRQVVTWARQNMELSGLQDIRWVVEDAMKFAKREEKRGKRYSGIILDPPAYGHGPDGEKWKLDECLFSMLKSVNNILEPRNSFLVLNLYSNGYSAALAETIAREAFGVSIARDNRRASGSQFSLDCGELALTDRFGKKLPLSVYVRIKTGN